MILPTAIRIEGCFERLVLENSRVGCTSGESLSLQQCGSTIVIYKGVNSATQKHHLHWCDLPGRLKLDHLQIACTRSVIVLDNIAFGNHATVAVSGTGNTVVFRHNQLNFLTLDCTAACNQLNFREQEPLQELDCTLSNSAIDSLQVVGYNESRLQASGNSVAVVNIPFSSHRRTFSFVPVGASRFFILAPDIPQGRFVENKEQWTVEAVLREITLNTELQTAAAEASSGTPICVACRECIPTIFLSPCRHLCFCNKCILYYEPNTQIICPICKSIASHREEVYITCA